MIRASSAAPASSAASERVFSATGRLNARFGAGTSSERLERDYLSHVYLRRHLKVSSYDVVMHQLTKAALENATGCEEDSSDGNVDSDSDSDEDVNDK